MSRGNPTSSLGDLPRTPLAKSMQRGSAVPDVAPAILPQAPARTVTSATPSVVSIRIAGAVPEPRVGFYTGSFDPPTRAHLGIVENLLDQHHFDSIVVVVNQNNAKAFKAEAADRAAMFKAGLQLQHRDRVQVVIESARGKNALFYELRETAEETMYRIIGQDSWDLVPAKVRAREDIHWVIIPRADQSSTVLPDTETTLIVQPPKGAQGISSTAVRNGLRDGVFDARALSPGVINYIRNTGLYRPPTGPALEEQRQRFVQLWREYAGNRGVTLAPPAFVDNQSPAEWPHYFDKYAAKRADAPAKG